MTRAHYSKSSEAFHIVLCEAENVTTLHIDHITILRSYYQPQHMSVVQSSISLTHVMLWMQASLLLLQEMRLLCGTQNRNESVSSECLLYDSLFVLKIMWCQYRSQSWLLQEHQVRWRDVLEMSDCLRSGTESGAFSHQINKTISMKSGPHCSSWRDSCATSENDHNIILENQKITSRTEEMTGRDVESLWTRVRVTVNF